MALLTVRPEALALETTAVTPMAQEELEVQAAEIPTTPAILTAHRPPDVRLALTVTDLLTLEALDSVVKIPATTRAQTTSLPETQALTPTDLATTTPTDLATTNPTDLATTTPMDLATTNPTDLATTTPTDLAMTPTDLATITPQATATNPPQLETPTLMAHQEMTTIKPVVYYWDDDGGITTCMMIMGWVSTLGWKEGLTSW